MTTFTLAVARTVPVGRHPQALALDVRTRRLFVANRDGNSVSVLDSRTGHPVGRPVRLGGTPYALAVDARDGHVFAIVGARRHPGRWLGPPRGNGHAGRGRRSRRARRGRGD